jgi:hypothetical protein
MRRQTSFGGDPEVSRSAARSVGCVGIGVLSLVLLAAPVLGEDGPDQRVRLLAPAAGQALAAGETITVRWSGIPAAADELELLLTVDGGELPLRLTPQLSPGGGGFRWVVPNLPSRRARLTLRYGLHGREVVSLPGEPFRIVGRADRLPGAVGYHDGEWWLVALPLDGSGERAPWRSAVHRPEPSVFTGAAAESSHERNGGGVAPLVPASPHAVSPRAPTMPVPHPRPQGPGTVPLRE